MSETAATNLYTALLAAPFFGGTTGKMVQLGQRNSDAVAVLETPHGVSQQEGTLMTEPQYTSVRPCAAPGCTKSRAKKSSYCPMHASRLYKHGNFDTPSRVRVHPVVNPATGCHDWTGFTDAKGYGRLGRDGRGMSAHRYFWIQRHGEIPEGMVLDHLCRNPRCCNPDHLELVTPGENTRRGNAPTMVAHRENRCLRGHALTPENTYRKTDGKRQCRICLRVVNNRAYARRKAARQ